MACVLADLLGSPEVKFEDLNIPLTVVAADVETRERGSSSTGGLDPGIDVHVVVSGRLCPGVAPETLAGRLWSSPKARSFPTIRSFDPTGSLDGTE
jgi:predicted acylesterase/phospholipase RssA